MADHEQENVRAAQISSYFKVDTASRSLKLVALTAYTGIVIVKQWARNSEIVWYDNVEDDKLTGKA